MPTITRSLLEALEKNTDYIQIEDDGFSRIPPLQTLTPTEQAFIIASSLHKTQKDKAGKPYKKHLISVSSYARQIITLTFHNAPTQIREDLERRAEIVGLLHDSLENIKVEEKGLVRPLMPADLERLQISRENINAIRMLTKKGKKSKRGSDDENRKEYINGLKHLISPEEPQSPEHLKTLITAVCVKMADNINNSEIPRLIHNKIPTQEDFARSITYLTSASLLRETLNSLHTTLLNKLLPS